MHINEANGNFVHPSTTGHQCHLKGILCDFFIFTLDQIIFLNQYCTYNKPYSLVKIHQDHSNIINEKVL